MLGPTLGSQDLYFLNFVTCKKLIHFFNFQFENFSGEAEQLREVANNQQPQIIDLDSDSEEDSRPKSMIPSPPRLSNYPPRY